MTQDTSGILGIVAIGRNEGARLRKCIASAKQASDFIVYVDSGSTDGSIDYAKSQGTVVVELDSDVRGKWRSYGRTSSSSISSTAIARSCRIGVPPQPNSWRRTTMSE